MNINNNKFLLKCNRKWGKSLFLSLSFFLLSLSTYILVRLYGWFQMVYVNVIRLIVSFAFIWNAFTETREENGNPFLYSECS